MSDAQAKPEAGRDAAPSHATFTVLINNKEFQTSAHVMTGAQIKELGGLPADYELYEVRGKESVPVGNDQEVRIHERIQFRAIPAGTFGT